MKQILIVDDEQPFLLSLQEGLSDQANYQVKTALNGQEALDILKTEKIDLLVTDLKMPVLDGFGLLAQMSGKYPGIPVIVMTAFGTEEIEQRLKKIDNFYYLEKPLDLELLVETIDQALQAGERSIIRGINMAAFLQLVQLEKKTCTLKIKSGAETGYLYIDQGNLMTAETGSLVGEEAAFKIVCWQNPEIEMEAVCRKKEQQINLSIEMLLLEAFRLEDEQKEAARQGQPAAGGQNGAAEPAAEAAAEPESDVFQLLKESSGIFYNQDTASKISADNERGGIRQAEQLSEYLHQSGSVLDFGIYVADDLLFAKKVEKSEMFKLCPSIYLTAIETLGGQLGQSRFKHLTIRRGQGPRMLVFVLDELQVVVALRPGIRGSEFVAEVKQLGPAEAAEPGRIMPT